MPRNFIQNKADITQYYINRAKKEEEKNQFKVVDTRRVRVPSRYGKSMNKSEVPIEHPIPPDPSPPLSLSSPPVQPSTPLSNNLQAPGTPDYRFLLAWSYYLATQATSLSPMLQPKPGQSPFSLPTDPEAAAKFLQAMQTVMNPLTTQLMNNNNQTSEQIEDEFDSETIIREKAN